MTEEQGQAAALIERDIRHTQDQIGATVQKLEDQLAPQQMVRAVVGADRADLVEEAFALVRRNPVPAALIVVGAIWLFLKSGVDARELLSRVNGGGPATIVS